MTFFLEELASQRKTWYVMTIEMPWPFPVSHDKSSRLKPVAGAVALPPEALSSRRLRVGPQAGFPGISVLVGCCKKAGFYLSKRIQRTLGGKDLEGASDVPHAMGEIWP